MKNQRIINVEPRGCHVNIKQRGTNKKAKNVKRGGEELRIQKPQSAKRSMKSVWKIHEVARGKGPLLWNWGVPHAKSD